MRGLSNELVCIPCADDWHGNALGRLAKLGKCSAEAVMMVFEGHICKDSTLCADGDASYRKFSRENGNSLVQIKGGRGTVKGIYHIQHLNAFHSKQKLFLTRFKDVSSNYLNNYLTWNNAVVHTRAGFRQKVADMLDAIADTLFSKTCLKVPKRPPIPILVKNQLNTKL